MIDLRSDTVTRPSPAMREAMARAEVGDDVFGDDPTVHALESEVAGIVGKQAAIYVPSGTMGNQLAIALQTRPGDEVIVGEGAHMAFYEAGAGAVLSGVQFAVAGAGGLYDADAMEARIHPLAYYAPRTRLVAIENTHNRAGGRLFPQKDIVAITERARKHGLAIHLDGARLWNASAASGLSPAEIAAPVDTVSVCFSKGLGAPVGSAFCGPKALVTEARRFRRRWGGAMRQAGILCAAALYALRNNRARVKEDHDNARAFAEGVSGIQGAHVDLAKVETNLVNVDFDTGTSAQVIADAARELGLAIHATGTHRLRAVTHLDVSRADCTKAAQLLAQAVARVRGA